MSDAPQHSRLNAAEIAALEKRIGDQIRSVYSDMEVRKLAAEMAVRSEALPTGLVELAENIYRFLTAPAAEVRVKLD